MKEAERSLADNDCIVRAFGVCEGILPFKMAKLFNLPPKDEGMLSPLLLSHVQLNTLITFFFVMTRCGHCDEV